MAFQLDSNIPLLARSGNPSQSIQQAVKIGSMVDQLRTTREEKPIRQQLLQQQQQAGELANQQQQQTVDSEAQNVAIKSVAQGAQEILPFINSGDFQGAANKLKVRLKRLVGEGVEDTSDTELAIQALESGDASQIQRIKTDANAMVNIAETRGLLTSKAGGNISADQKGFEKLISKLTPEQQKEATEVRAGIRARAGSSSQERIAANEELKAQVVDLESQIAEAKEFGKGKGLSKAAPLIADAKSKIATAVTLATKEATSRGEVLSDLRKAEAGLPGLEEVVGKLSELSSIATHTITGKAFNLISKEFGFGSTEGGTARAAYQATIDNQVLPLLKQTFGAAMTEGEGKRLAATLGDVDAPPEEKQAQLNAFMESQRRQIENLKREAKSTDFTSSSGITFTVK